eukprot:3671384-Rhodomonas_salina.1
MHAKSPARTRTVFEDAVVSEQHAPTPGEGRDPEIPDRIMPADAGRARGWLAGGLPLATAEEGRTDMFVESASYALGE